MKEKSNKKEMFPGDDLAKSVWKNKYADKGETHYDEMHERMAKEFYKADIHYQPYKTP